MVPGPSGLHSGLAARSRNAEICEEPAQGREPAVHRYALMGVNLAQGTMRRKSRAEDSIALPAGIITS